MHKDQKMWDACFIKAWREDKTVGELFDLFKMVLNQDAREMPELERVPFRGFPNRVKLRVFTGAYMKKINDRLWAVGPERDVDLLNKLQTVHGGIHKQKYRSNGTREMEAAGREKKRNMEKVALNYRNYKNRNHDTDWNVVK